MSNTTSAVSDLAPSPALESFGLKFSVGGAHISRTMMLEELTSVLDTVPIGSGAGDYREAVTHRNVLAKTTDSTRQKSLRHLRELYGLDESIPVFGLLRRLVEMSPPSLPLLALMVAWSRDPLLRATTPAIFDASEGERVETTALALAVEATFPAQYSELNRHKIARNAASSWTQSGHLAGRTTKIRRLVKPDVHAVTMAFILGEAAGHHGAAVFASPWCQLLDLTSDRARSLGGEAHRAGLINLRAIGEVVELSFPLFTPSQESQ